MRNKLLLLGLAIVLVGCLGQEKIEIETKPQPKSHYTDIFGLGTPSFTRDGNLFNADGYCDDSKKCTERYHCIIEDHKCKRDSIFPMELRDYFGIVTLAVLMALAIAAGLGGGEIIVPVIKIIFLFVQAEASTMSQYCIFMACITRFVVNYNKKHPYRDAVPIDYKVAMVLLPCIFLGISIGVMFHTMVPNVIQEVLLISVLIFCLREAITKGIKFWKQETLDKQKAKLKIENSSVSDDQQYIEGETENLLDEDNTDSDIKQSKSNTLYKGPQLNTGDISDSSMAVPSPIFNKKLIEEVARKDKSHWQFDKLIPIWIILVLLIMQSMIKDSNIFGVKNCSAVYWIVYVLYIIMCICVVIYTIKQLDRDNKYREEIKFPDYRGNVKYPIKKIVIIAIISILAGLFSSIIGVGGSQFYIPMLLILGYPPFVASSTSIFLVMNSSFANAVSYTIRGDINVYNGLWYGMWTAVGVFIGVTGANKIVQKTGRQSIFLIILAFVLIISLVMSILFNTLEVIDQINDGDNVFEVGSICN